jgi:hypothetical protein
VRHSNLPAGGCPWPKFRALRAPSFSAPLGLTPAQARAKGFILWTPSLFPGEALPSTRQDLAALDPPPLLPIPPSVLTPTISVVSASPRPSHQGAKAPRHPSKRSRRRHRRRPQAVRSPKSPTGPSFPTPTPRRAADRRPGRPASERSGPVPPDFSFQVSAFQLLPPKVPRQPADSPP